MRLKVGTNPQKLWILVSLVPAMKGGRGKKRKEMGMVKWWLRTEPNRERGRVRKHFYK